MQPRVAVLASGAGTNLEALLNDPVVAPGIVVVASDRPDAGALERARARGIAAEFVDPAESFDREGYDRALRKRLEDAGVDHVLLAGFMRVLTEEMVSPFEGRTLNVHPSLLPAFPGANAPRDALAAGAKVTGATVHLVELALDAGPIVLQEAVAIEPQDDERTLHSRIQEVEHRIYPAAARALIQGRLSIDGRIVWIVPEPRA
ncbi:MAG: phosphoribosylglycinamide formyltransferase [Actinomycetota bacterium]